MDLISNLPIENQIEQECKNSKPLFLQYSHKRRIADVCEQLHGSRKGSLRYFNPSLFDNDEFVKTYMFSGGLDRLFNFQDCINGTLVIENTHLLSLETQKVLRTFLDVVERKKFKIRMIFLSLYSLDLHKEAGLIDLPFFYRIKENVLDLS